jgi:cytochrome c oxidase assembly factor CtaG
MAILAASLDPGASAIVVVIAALCALLSARIAGAAPARRMRPGGVGPALIGAGLVAFLAAYFGLYHAARSSLTTHEAQLLIGGELAGALIALGLCALPAVRSDALLRGRLRTSPAIAAALWVANLAIWHLRAVLEAAIHHPLIGALQYACFAAAGINIWLALLGGRIAARSRELGAVLYTLALRIPAVALANVLLWSSTVFYPWYIHPSIVRQTSPLVDQNVAGAVLLFANVLLGVAVLIGAYLSARAKLPALAGAARAGEIAETPTPVLEGAGHAARSFEGSASRAGS